MSDDNKKKQGGQGVIKDEQDIEVLHATIEQLTQTNKAMQEEIKVLSAKNKQLSTKLDGKLLNKTKKSKMVTSQEINPTLKHESKYEKPKFLVEPVKVQEAIKQEVNKKAK